uniref:Uncharacterized protein n=1 Tax=Arundo donax TaxID=35708 RepID=A0A0A9CPH7_ARUDO
MKLMGTSYWKDKMNV